MQNYKEQEKSRTPITEVKGVYVHNLVDKTLIIAALKKLNKLQENSDDSMKSQTKKYKFKIRHSPKVRDHKKNQAGILEPKDSRL